ncbi:uncharacterized protein LOC130182478 [Seriola aureovittata]|uniref:uncharacterized protein LOC130182478 n=1 Tax=Seriola aureovittata TaxID=2871759 RepID=UPI0024BE6FBF|nr:uncharacterized protein LOC130182478 [Seriola aureovittata]
MISETEWKEALTSSLEELESPQYRKMLEMLDKIPTSVKTERSREEMARIIIEHYGLEGSISVIDNVMDQIPRRDERVQGRLRLFVEKLRQKQKEETKGKKRKRKSDLKSKDNKKEAAAGFMKNGIISDSDSSDEEQEADQQKSCKSDKENIPSWRETINDLRNSDGLFQKPVAGKIVQKSCLRSYETKEKVKRFFFYVAVADETSCIKVMVYGEERFEKIKEKNFYIFKNVKMEMFDRSNEKVLKVFKYSTVSRTTRVDVPEKLEVEAQTLIYRHSPIFSIAKAKLFDDKTLVSVEGTVTKIDRVEHVKLKTKRGKKEKRDFILKDDTGSIRITLWGNDTQQLRDKSHGDFVRVTNMKTSVYFDLVSLNSTDHTSILKIPNDEVLNVTLKIIGITVTKMETHLEAETNDQVETFFVESKLLAKAVGVRLDGDFEERLLQKMPFSADVVLQGSKINKITASEKM